MHLLYSIFLKVQKDTDVSDNVNTKNIARNFYMFLATNIHLSNLRSRNCSYIENETEFTSQYLLAKK